MILFVNACPRKESRTKRLALALLETLGEAEEVCLETEKILPMTGETLEKRDALLSSGALADPAFRYARQFSGAEEIVIAAPYWDLSFPAELKAYIESVCVMGIASCYDETGCPRGLCHAKKLWYVTTSGGPLIPDFGYGYLHALAESYFGIPETELVFAENLDIAGNDPEAILAAAIGKIKEEKRN